MRFRRRVPLPKPHAGTPWRAAEFCVIDLETTGLDLRRDEAPTIEQAADDLIDLLTNRVLVAHAAWIERAFLSRALRPRGIALGSAVIDTAALLRAYRLADLDPASEPDLEATSRRLGLPVHTPHHALGDAFTTAQLFLALATRLEHTPAANRPLTLRHLYAISRHHSL